MVEASVLRRYNPDEYLADSGLTSNSRGLRMTKNRVLIGFEYSGIRVFYMPPGCELTTHAFYTVFHRRFPLILSHTRVGYASFGIPGV